MEKQTVTVTGNWLDLFIESVTIYSIGKGPSSDVMGYINITSKEELIRDVTLLYKDTPMLADHWMQSRIPTRSNRWMDSEREGQGTLCCYCDDEDSYLIQGFGFFVLIAYQHL